MKITTRKLAVIGMLGGISIMLEFGGVGIIQLPFLPVQVTIMHIPTIIGAIVEGPVVGLFIGLIFGGFSMYRAFTQPSVLSVAFMNPLVSILPRLAIALTSYYSFKGIKNLLRGKGQRGIALSTMVASAVGTLTNTIGVLGIAYLLYKDVFAKMLNVEQSMVGKAVIYGIAIPNGVPEAIAAVLIITPIVQALRKFYKGDF
ncbi:MAG TPA: ECF transporter S component [Clostridia bacterium]|nr:ECF transporter S component [Clostridia bacterium]